MSKLDDLYAAAKRAKKAKRKPAKRRKATKRTAKRRKPTKRRKPAKRRKAAKRAPKTSRSRRPGESFKAHMARLRKVDGPRKRKTVKRKPAKRRKAAKRTRPWPSPTTKRTAKRAPKSSRSRRPSEPFAQHMARLRKVDGPRKRKSSTHQTVQLILANSISERDFSAIKRFAENVTKYWPEFAATNLVVKRGSGLTVVSVRGCDKSVAAKLKKAVLNELAVLEDSLSVGW